MKYLYVCKKYPDGYTDESIYRFRRVKDQRDYIAHRKELDAMYPDTPPTRYADWDDSLLMVEDWMDSKGVVEYEWGRFKYCEYFGAQKLHVIDYRR